ncbi:MAG: DNA gyrase subunit A [Caldisericia bacterium]|nr:DNA gyrase subunit A [Caldisericia bacterium]
MVDEVQTNDDLFEQQPEQIQDVSLVSEIKKSYLAYAMSVIVGRALPNVRDGLKPVHRRILFSMQELGNFPSKPYKKCAKVVGQVLGNYHPHGETAIYDALVRMAQDFSMRYTLVDGHGNFGSVDGDSAAAMRYTECRLAKISMEMLEELAQETVVMTPNFDASLEEPTYLPSKIPTLLINGSSGIAVGMATNVPPHNINEILQATIHVIDNPYATTDDLLEIIKGPDFPTGGYIVGQEGIRKYFETGKGSFIVRGKGHIEEDKNHILYIIDELPYQVNKSEFIKKIAELVKNKRIQGIVDLRDESDRNGMRVAIVLKRNINPKILENQLYKMTQYQTSFGSIMLTLVDNQPLTLPMKNLLEYFIQHREDIITKRTNFELRKSNARLHILEGLRKAIQNIDEIIKLIRASKDTQEARETLVSRFEFTEPQVKAILDMSLSRLTGMEQQKIEDEISKLLDYIRSLEWILESKENLHTTIKNELEEIRQKYGDERKTEIGFADNVDKVDEMKLIHDDDVVITLSRDGYVKRMKVATQKTQQRGGKGSMDRLRKADDELTNVFCSSNHKSVIIFSDQGKAYDIKTYKIPEADKKQKGNPISYLIASIDPEEKVTAICAYREMKKDDYIALVTNTGVVKKVQASLYENIRKSGIKAINLKPGEFVADAKLVKNTDTVFLLTKLGQAVRFDFTQLRSLGRTARGVKGVQLKPDDAIVAMAIEEPDCHLFCISSKGTGKVTPYNKFRKTNRGSKGVKAMRLSKGETLAACTSIPVGGMNLVIVTLNGKMIQIDTKQIPTLNRVTQGVSLIKTTGQDRVIAVTTEPKVHI